MAAPKGGSDSGNTAGIVMVIFIFLFLVSAGLAIALYVNIEKYNKQAKDAQAQLTQFGNAQQINEIKKLAESANAEGGKTLDKLSSVIRDFSGSLIGQDQVNFNLATAKANIDNRLESVWQEAGGILGLSAEEAKSKGMAGVVTDLIVLVDTLNNDMSQLAMDANQQLDSSAQKIEAYENRINELQTQIDSLGMTVANMKNQTNDSIDDIQARFENHVRALQKEKDDIQKQTDKMREELDLKQVDVDKLTKKAEELEEVVKVIRPKPTEGLEALDPDGTIISVDARERMVYINLAANDKIYRGLTFGVYDGLDKTVPASGQGKATIEVVEILDSISRCRVVETRTTNPIIKGDIIANLIWDKDKEFNFCVVGDFDFDMDGEVNIDGYERIVNLVKSWGGKVVNNVSVDTDFLVYGYEPMAPQNILSGSQEATDAAEKAMQKVEQYKMAIDEGARLGVPSFNMKRFFRFIGYSEKQVSN